MINSFKVFITDKTELLMTLVGAMFVVFNVILVLLQINTTKSVAIIRYNAITLPEFTRGNTRSLYIFAIAPLLFFLINIVVAVKMHEKNASLAKIVMGLGYIVLIFGIIVSSAVINVNK